MLKHRSQLVLTYILFSLEMLGGLLRPFFLGVVINDLMKGRYEGLIILSVLFYYLVRGYTQSTCMIHVPIPPFM